MGNQDTRENKPNLETLLAQVRDGRITEDQFHEQTNGSWNDFAESKGGLVKFLRRNSLEVAAYSPPKMERYNPDAEYPSGTIIFEHLHGVTTSYSRIIGIEDRGSIPKKGIYYAITP